MLRGCSLQRLTVAGGLGLLTACTSLLGDFAVGGGPGVLDASSDGAAVDDAQSNGDSTSSGDSAPSGDAGPDGPTYAAAPRPISPLSTSHVTSQRPTLTWKLPAGATAATVDLCNSPTCSSPVSTLVMGTSFTPAAALSPGVHFWRLHPGSDTSLASPTWEFTVGAVSATLDGGPGPSTSWGTTLDLDRNGCADFVVGADQLPSGGAGYAAVYLGSANAISSAMAPSKVLTGPAGAFFGAAVASAGDLNGDGYGDLAVGAYGAQSNTGTVSIYLGGPSGLSSTPDVTLVGPDGANGAFGQSVAAAGDLNADGYGDLIVGAEGASSFSGKAYVYYGAATLGGDAGAGLTAGPVLTGSTANYQDFGSSVASAGDVDGDGLPDLVVGAFAISDSQAFLFLGRDLTTAIPLANPGGVTDGLGRSLAGVGDVNGDGYADVVVGAYKQEVAYLYYGSKTGLPATPVTIADPASAGLFGVAVSGAGDVNGDGYADVVIGASGANSGAGGAYLFLGGASGLSPSPANATQSLPYGAAANAGYGSAVAGTGNSNCGLYSGIAGSGTHNGYVGEAIVVAGGSGGLGLSDSILAPPEDGGTDFGCSMFGTTN